MKRLLYLFSTFLLLFLFSACGSKVANHTSAINESTTSVDFSSEADPSSPSSRENSILSSAAQEAVLSLGEEGMIQDWSVTVTGIDFLSEVQANEFSSYRPEEGNLYLIVNLSVTNKGKQADRFMPSISLNSDVSVKILYGDGYEFSSTQFLAYDEDMHDTQLNPLSSKTGIAAFEVPESISKDTEVLILELSAGVETLCFQLR